MTALGLQEILGVTCVCVHVGMSVGGAPTNSNLGNPKAPKGAEIRDNRETLNPQAS